MTAGRDSVSVKIDLTKPAIGATILLLVLKLIFGFSWWYVAIPALFCLGFIVVIGLIVLLGFLALLVVSIVSPGSTKWTRKR